MISNSVEIKLIINADDFGICPERDSGICELFLATLLINGTNVDSAIKKAKEIGLPLGLHLNLTEGPSISKLANSTLENNGEMLGKLGFREKLEKKLIKSDDILKEINSQIETFVEKYEDCPTHIDGHQHVHVLPEVAEILAHVMTTVWGIYKIRIPIENDISFEKFGEEGKRFFEKVFENARISKQIYEKNNVRSPELFFGIEQMRSFSEEKIIEKLEKISFQGKNDIIVEFMCHPGYKGNCWDDFNKSNDRENELKVLKSLNLSKLSNKITNISYENLDNVVDFSLDSQIIFYNVLIYCDLKIATGNYTTAMRFKQFIEELEFPIENIKVKTRVFCRPTRFCKDSAISIEKEAKNLQETIFENNINFVLGIHLWKAGKALQLIFQEKKFVNIPFAAIIAGTDANISVYEENKQKVIEKMCKNAEVIISFNEKMVKKLKEKVNFSTPFIIHPQTPNEITYNSNFSFYKLLNLDENIKLIILTASFRGIKDISYIFEPFCELLNEFENHRLILIGPILELNYYNAIKNEISTIFKEKNKIDKVILMDYLSYENYLCCSLLLNSSVTEGMNGSILEAMKRGIPVLVRAIEGNLEVIKDEYNGLTYDNKDEFKIKYRKLFTNSELRKKIKKNAIKDIDTRFNIKNEKKIYQDFVKNSFEKYYKIIKVGNTYLKMFCDDKNVHPISLENIDLFLYLNKVEINQEKEIKILDIGAGSGIFSFILILFLLEKKNIIKKIVFSDIDENALQICQYNFNINKEKFGKELTDVHFIKSDMFENIEKDKFNFVLANLPQTPSKTKFRLDKWGGEDGAFYKILYIEKLNNYLDSQGIGIILNISLSDQIRFKSVCDKYYISIGKIYSQKRKIKKDELDYYCTDIYNTLIQLYKEKKALINLYENESLIEYDVDLIFLKKS